MNILYLCDEYPPGKHGGIGTVVQTLGREMVRQGHTVVVAGIYNWGYGGENHFMDNGVEVYRFRYKLASKWFYKHESLRVRGSYKVLDKLGVLQWDIKRSLDKYGKFLEQLINKHEIDIVEMADYCDYMRFCKEPVYFPKLSVPVVVKLHGNMTYFAREAGTKEPLQVHAMEQDIFNEASAITSVSKYTADRIQTYFRIDKEIEVVYNGIDTNVKIQEVNKIPGRVIFSGTLVEKKGIYQLMKAWNVIAEANKNATLWVFGKGSTAKAESLLTEVAKSSVSFKGHVSHESLLNNIEMAVVGVFPSYAETFGLAPLESMLHNTAVIFTTRTSGPEVVEDYIDGILIDPDNIGEIAEKILYLLDNLDVAGKLAANAQKKVRQEFDIHVIAKRNSAIYEQLLKKVNA